MLLSGLVGIATAWAINQYRYGNSSQFGPLGTHSNLTVDTAAKYLESLTPSAGSPKITVVDGETTHDFGIMSPGDQGEHTFKIENQGLSDLTLRLGASTCKCTIGSLERESIPPGESTSVKLNWTIESDDTSFSQSAQILTNDPTKLALTFAIVGKVVRDVDVVPETWTFGEVAAGESFEISGTLYNFMDSDIDLVEPTFSDSKMTELAEFTVEPFAPTPENDGVRASARQGFHILAKVGPGMRQGSLSPKLIVGFHELDPNGDRPSNSAKKSDQALNVLVPIDGRIIGPLSMILNEKIREFSGAYVFDLGRIRKNDSLTTKAFIVFKGAQRDNTTLRIGEVFPDGVIKATLGEPKGSGPTKLFPLTIELIPGSESVERNGLSKDDYGTIWIESDNPKVPRMRVALKFSLDGR